MVLAGAASITIVNRDPTHGSELVVLLNEKTPARADLVGWDRAYRIPETSDIIVNATSIGLFPHVEDRLDLNLDSLRPGLVIADVIPNPSRTQLIRDAEARGCVVLDGLECWSARVQSVSGIGLESNLYSNLCAGSSNTSSAFSTESKATDDQSKSGISFSQSSISSWLSSPLIAPFAGLFAGRTLPSILWPSIQSLISSTSAPVDQARVNFAGVDTKRLKDLFPLVVPAALASQRVAREEAVRRLPWTWRTFYHLFRRTCKG